MAGAIARIVVHRDSEGFGEGFTHGQGLNGRVAVVERVGPALAAACTTGGAGDGREAEAAVLGGAGGDAGGLDVGEIEIGEGHRTCGNHLAVFCDSTALGGAGDDDFVVAAGDRDGDDLIDVAAFLIGDADCEEVRDGFSRRQALNHRAGVGQRVGPLAAVALEGERAVVADAAGSASLDAPGGGGAGIDVAGAEHACGADGAVFCDGAGGIACGEGNDRMVIGAGYRDGDAACNRAAVTIKDIEGEGFNLGLILG